MEKGKRFSIVIALAPERNAEVLRSLEKLDYLKNQYEVIIERGKNPSENRNRGASKARGKIIFFVDDDAVVDSKILKKAGAFFAKHKEIDIVGGPQLTPKDEKGFAKISGYALSSLFGAWKISNRYSGKKTLLKADETMLTSANLFCRKKVFRKIKFDPLLFPGEDPKFISDAKKSELGVAYSPELVVYHRRRASFRGLSKQILSYGKTRAKKESLRETLKMPFFLVPSIFVIYLFILLITILMGNFYFPIYIPLIIYFLLNLSFSLADSISNQDTLALFILPFVYLTIHLSYGLGFLLYSVRYIFKKENR